MIMRLRSPVIFVEVEMKCQMIAPILLAPDPDKVVKENVVIRIFKSMFKIDLFTSDLVQRFDKRSRECIERRKRRLIADPMRDQDRRILRDPPGFRRL